MSGAPSLADDPIAAQADALLRSLDTIDLERYTIVGDYIRFDEPTRGSLKEFRQRIVQAYQGPGVDPRNFLIWGAPGSGKSFLVHEVANELGDALQYRELNLAQLDQEGFRAGLNALERAGAPVLCLIDEVDSKPKEPWPYEMLLPYLEPPTPRSHRFCFCLAGSGGRDVGEMKAMMAARPKGRDLLSRVAAGNEFIVPSLGVGDKILVSTVQLLLSARAEGHEVREIEKLALYYVAVNPAFASARQLRSLASQSGQRIPPGEDRVKYDHLFNPGDPENKEFWVRAKAAGDRLASSYIHVVPGARQRAPASASPATPSSAPRPPAGEDRVVVLPFTNISPDPADEFFADGMTEELIERLAHVSGIKVIARTTSMHYKGRRETALEIGRTLNVGKVVECSVRKAGNRIRVTAQLIDTVTEEHLWASRYDRQFDDIFAIQDDIAGQIASSLADHVVPRAGADRPSYRRGSPDTADLEAYTDFLHGQKLFGEKSSEATIRRALELFESAVRRDPSFARARVGVAEALLWLNSEGALPLASAYPRARAELERARELNPQLAEAHSALAGLLLGEDDMAGAEREARRAIELNPSLCEPYRWLAQIEAGVGRIEETVRLLENAHQLDPVNVNIIAFLGRAYMYAGREADALAFWERTRPLIPFRTNAHLTEYYLGHAKFDEAAATVRELERLRPDSMWTLTYRGMLEARTGHPELAREAIERLENRAEGGEVTVFLAGFIRYALGDLDGFVANLEEAFQQHALPLLELRYSPMFVAGRSDPRVLDLLRRQLEYHAPRPPS
jgi:TolB-like protein/tetratricopeptide (TPR) repeat protein